MTNIGDNNFEKLEEKPSINYTYAGFRFSSSEIVNLYIEAVKENDVKMIESLQLENFYREVLDEIRDKKYVSDQNTDIYTEYGYYNEAFPILEYQLINNRYIYLKNNLYINIYDSSELIVSSGTYGNYNFYRYVLYFGYCYNNSCRIIDGEEVNDYTSRIVIELIEVGGNYYIC